MLIHVVKSKITRNLQKGQWDIKSKRVFPSQTKETRKKKENKKERDTGKNLISARQHQKRRRLHSLHEAAAREYPP